LVEGPVKPLGKILVRKAKKLLSQRLHLLLCMIENDI
jgi:hypothetical protein